MTPNQLFRDVIEGTGLPDDIAEKELLRILAAAGVNADSLNLQDLRELMVDYLQEVLPRAKEALASGLD